MCVCVCANIMSAIENDSYLFFRTERACVIISAASVMNVIRSRSPLVAKKGGKSDSAREIEADRTTLA